MCEIVVIVLRGCLRLFVTDPHAPAALSRVLSNSRKRATTKEHVTGGINNDARCIYAIDGLILPGQNGLRFYRNVIQVQPPLGIVFCIFLLFIVLYFMACIPEAKDTLSGHFLLIE